MSQASPNSQSNAIEAHRSSITALLRRWLYKHRSLVILSSAAVAATAIAGVVPSERPLSAAQSSTESNSGFAMSTPAASTNSSGMEIVPRGADANQNTVPFRRNVAPERTRRESKQTSSDSKTPIAGRRAVLQSPIFSAPGTVPAAPLAGRSNQTTGNVQASRVTPTKPTSSVAGYNYVDAANIASLPYAGLSTDENGNSLPFTVPANGDDLSIPPLELPPAPGQRGPVPPVPVSPVPAVPNQPPLTQPPLTQPPLTQPPLTRPEGSPSGLPQELHGQQQNPGQSEFPSGQMPSNQSPAAQFPVDTPQSEIQVPNHQPQMGPGTSPAPSRVLPNGGHSFSGSAPGTSGFRATIEADAPRWMGPYMGRAGEFPAGAEISPMPTPMVEMSPDFSAWWDVAVRQRAGIAPRAIPVDVTTLVQQALIHSPQVQVLQADPEVQLRIVKQEEAIFDWRAFLDTKYDDLNDPIGNTLTTGNNDDRFTDRHLVGSGGVKRKTTTGGELKLAQQLGYQDNNSRFLLPNPQSTSRLELSFRQPLLSQAGTVYSQSQIVLARISANSSGDQTLEELQKHLYSVAEVYWRLYRARAEFFQRQKLLASARNVLATLEGRNQVDTIPRQILRARASVARAESRMQRAVTDIRNAESQLRLLVNDPEMLNGGPVEFMPTETPCMLESPVELRESLQTALVNRPDISQAIRQMRASGVRMGVSKSEMLPKLDFIVSSYVAGLENKAQFVDSVGNQFTDGRPGYTVGMEFEVPLGNRAGRARVEQRQWELKRAINSFRSTVETSLTEVEIATREVETSWRELLGKYQAMMAAQNEVSYLQDRFEVLPMAEESSILLLEDLLDGFERLADEESAFAQAQSMYALSIIQLRRATGTLMRSRHDAPELENTESEWMTTRAEELAGEADARTHAVSLKRDRSADLQDAVEDSRTPAVWTRPVGERPAPQTPAAEAKSKPVTKAPAKPVTPRLGGHSFGSEF